MDINSDAQGLVDRERLNRTNERRDFTQWARATLSAPVGGTTLDIGCGTGKQLLSIAPDVGPSGRMFGADISREALAIAAERLAADGVANVTLTAMPMDEVPDRFAGETFDLIYSVYAFYYSRDMAALLGRLHARLAPGGRVMLFGPGQSSNREIIDVINRLRDTPIPYYPAFLAEINLDSLSPLFEIVRGDSFMNEIAFANSAEVMTWLQTSEMNAAAPTALVAAAIDRVVAERGNFSMSKETAVYSLRKIG